MPLVSDLARSTLTPVATLERKFPESAESVRAKPRRFRKLINVYTITGGLLVLFALGFIIAGTLFGQSADLQTAALDTGPSSAHLFGTDSLGRDLFARTAAGGLVSIEVALGSAFVATVIGLPLGMFAGFYPTSGRDEVIMRVMDVVLALPLLVLGVCVMGFIGSGGFSIGPILFPPVVKVILLLGVAGAPIVARVARSAVLIEREEDYVDALRVVGVPKRTILFNDILRNVAPAVVVQATAWMATAIFAEAGLGFLGLGIQPPAATLGNILQEASGSLLLGEWWLAVFPGAMAVIVIAGFNLVGEGLGRALFEPPR
jgi:ABC-type dipeptide/oligopeptide/nickel transport system permease subunit